MAKLIYQLHISPLPSGEGAGFLATVPDLPGRMSDGETPQEALSNVREAIESWIEAARDMRRDVPLPSTQIPLG